jgi:hypothetical protein
MFHFLLFFNASTKMAMGKYQLQTWGIGWAFVGDEDDLFLQEAKSAVEAFRRRWFLGFRGFCLKRSAHCLNRCDRRRSLRSETSFWRFPMTTSNARLYRFGSLNPDLVLHYKQCDQGQSQELVCGGAEPK